MKLDVRGIRFSYESESVLDDVTVAVDAGEILGIIGPNGAGKSTLLRCINRILTPTAGTVFVDGADVHEASRNDLARTFGYVPQHEDTTFPTTVFDTILMGRKPYIRWRPSDEDREAVSRIIEVLGLQAYALRDLDELSGGQRQTVMIGRALAQEAEVLLLDEPTGSLDVRHQLEVLDVIRDQVDQGITAVMAMHDLNLASRYCDRLVMLHEERVFAAGTPDILTAENIRAVYDVEATVVHHDGRRIVIPEHPAPDSSDRQSTELVHD